MKHKVNIYLISLFLALTFTISHAEGFEGKIVNRGVNVDLSVIGGDSYLEETPEKQQAIGMKYMTKSTEELRKIAGVSKKDGSFSEIAFETFIKDKKMRMDMQVEGKKVSYIIDLNDRIIFIIQWEQKMVIKMKMDEMKNQMQDMMQMAQKMQQSDKADQKPKDLFSLKSAGKKEKVNGYDCEIFQGTDSEGQPMMVWLSKGLDADLKSAMQEMEEALGKINQEETDSKEINFYKKEQGIPMIKKSLQDNMLNIHEILKVEKISIADDKFQIPDGFKEMDMMKMMQGMGF